MVEDTRKLGTVKVLMVKGQDGETQDISGKADKVSGATNGHLAGLNASGNLTDSGIAASSVVTTASLPLSTANGGTGNTEGYIRTGAASGSTIGTKATAEGVSTTASGSYAHAEGESTTASGNDSHAEGGVTIASGDASHAEGYETTASGHYSHAGGIHTVAGYERQTVIGEYNSNKSTTLFEVGNGTSSSAKSNAFEVYSDGKISCDNGSSKFKFTQNSGVDGYYDASGTFHALGSGGSSISKTRYTISSSSWSASANADEYYTYTQTLSPAVKSSPDVYVAGSTDSTQPTAAQRVQFGYVERCKVNGSTLTLYAKNKPTATFYIWVEGEEGTASGDIVGNIVPSGIENIYRTTEEVVVGYWNAAPIYRKVLDVGYLPNNGVKTVSFTTATVQNVIRQYGYMKKPTIGYHAPLPFVNGDVSSQVNLICNGSNVEITTRSDRSEWYANVIIEYIKA